mmetsp:Transcript_26340/g.42223  ORF Transcript_26340/g.42223 Transcript_26340/m.42223 type:complete len:102 (-) Transcript_26340:477-782(-)
MREERAEIDDNFGPKEQQYLAEETACQARRRRDGMRGYLTHDALMAMQARHAQLSMELVPMEARLERLRVVPPDAELAAMAIEDRRRRIQLATREIETALE